MGITCVSATLKQEEGVVLPLQALDRGDFPEGEEARCEGGSRLKE